MRYLKRCLGVDIGTSAVKIVELVAANGTVEVVKAVHVDTNIDPAMAPEERRAALLSAMKEAVKKGRFSTKKAVFGLSGLKVFFRRFRLPETSPERLDRIVQYEARQQIPFPLDKTELQHQYFKVDGEPEVDVLLVASRSDEVREFASLIEKSGLTAISIGVTTLAIFNTQALMRLDRAKAQAQFAPVKPKAPKKGKKGAPVVEETPLEPEFVPEEVRGYLNIGATCYELAVARNGRNSNLGFTRTPPTGSNNLTRAIMETLQIPSFNDAERIKRTSTRLMSFDLGLEEDTQSNEDASLAVADATEALASDIRRSLDFYISQPDGVAVDAIEVSGGGALLNGIESFLEDKLQVPCVVVKSPPEGSALQWPQAAGPMTGHLVAVGLALQGVGYSRITVDFLPQERKILRDFPYRSVAVMALLVAAAIGLSLQTGQTVKAQYEASAQNIEGRLLKDQQSIKLAETAQTAHNEAAMKIESFAKSAGQRDYWLRFLARVASAKPVDVLLENIDMKSNGDVVVRGISETQKATSDFANKLKELLPSLAQEAALTELTETRDQRFPRPVYRFEIRLTTGDKLNRLDIRPTPVAGPGTMPGQPPRPPVPGSPLGGGPRP